MKTGVIKTLTDKGFGFIAPAGEDKDIFFHANSLVNIDFDQLQQGDNVSFEVEETDKGMNATNVNLLEDAPAPAATASDDTASDDTASDDTASDASDDATDENEEETTEEAAA